MKVKIILFPRGGGGNFLGRIFTLDTTTVPLGALSIDTLNNVDARAKAYHYSSLVSQIKSPFNYPSKDGLSQWVDIELNTMYFPLTLGIETLVDLNRTVVEPIHEDHYETKKELFGSDDQLDLFYLDASGCEEWVLKQKQHKISTSATLELTTNEINNVNQLAEKYSAEPISLFNIISSDVSFLSEYCKISDLMGFKIYKTHALEIYKSWKQTWGGYDQSS